MTAAVAGRTKTNFSVASLRTSRAVVRSFPYFVERRFAVRRGISRKTEEMLHYHKRACVEVVTDFFCASVAVCFAQTPLLFSNGRFITHLFVGLRNFRRVLTRFFPSAPLPMTERFTRQLRIKYEERTRGKRRR